MANHLQKITTRAKQIYKAHPKKKWTECIKAASRELKASGKIGTAKLSNYSRQTGRSSKKRDEERKAKLPGKRLVKNKGGKTTVYYERRKNRSDAPGKLTGFESDFVYKMIGISKANYDRLKREVKEAEGKHKAAKDVGIRYILKRKLDRLKFELRERKSVLAHLAASIKKIK